VQECPQADLAIAAAASAAIRSLYSAKWSSLAAQQTIGSEALATILLDCIRDAEQAQIEDTGYLRLLGFPGRRCTAGELWRHLVAGAALDTSGPWREPLGVMLDHGPLARRILRALGRTKGKTRLHAVYQELCDCLEAGRMFVV